MDVIFRLPHPRIGNSQRYKTLSAPSADKQTQKYDIECSNHHPSLSNLRPNGLSRSKLKWWDIYKNLPVDVIVRLPHPWSGNSQGRGTFSAPSSDKQTRNYDIECSNHHPSLSNIRPKGLSSRKMKWWAIHTNLKVEVIVRLPHPRIANSHGQKTFSAPSADKQTRNLYIECSNHQPPLSTLSPKGLFRSKMKWWAIYTNFPVDVVVRLPHLGYGDSQGQETFLAPSVDAQSRKYDIECSNHHSSLPT